MLSVLSQKYEDPLCLEVLSTYYNYSQQSLNQPVIK